MNNTVNNYLISIRKPFTDLLFHTDPFEFVKTNEWRKKPLPIGHYFVYESKYKRGRGKVVGEFDIVENHEFPIGSISFEDCQAHNLVHQGIVPYGFLKHYASGAEVIYANIIKNAKYYDTPREIGEFKPVLSDKNIRCKYISKPYNPYGKQVVHCTLQKCYCEFHSLASQTDCCGYEPLKETKPLTRPPQSWCRISI